MHTELETEILEACYQWSQTPKAVSVRVKRPYQFTYRQMQKLWAAGALKRDSSGCYLSVTEEHNQRRKDEEAAREHAQRVLQALAAAHPELGLSAHPSEPGAIVGASLREVHVHDMDSTVPVPMHVLIKLLGHVPAK